MNRYFRYVTLISAALLTVGGALAADVEEALKARQESYSLTGSPRDAVAQLAEMGKVTVEVDWDALQRADANLTEKVVVKGQNATLGQVLELLLAQIAAPRKPLGYYIDGNTVHVTTQSRVISRRTRAALTGATTVKAAGSAAQPGAAREYKFEGVALQDVVQYFRELTGLNIHVNWRSMETVGVERGTPVSFTARGVTVATALDLMLRDVNADKDKLSSLYWVVDKGIVRIATGDVFNREMRTVVYDIADLLAVSPQFKGPRVDINTAGRAGDDSSDSSGDSGGGIFTPEDDEDSEKEEESPAQMRARQQEAIITTIKDSIGEDMWRPSGEGSITVLPNRKQLVITQSLLGFKLMRQTLGN
jgi:hypothetical protein